MMIVHFHHLSPDFMITMNGQLICFRIFAPITDNFCSFNSI